MEVVKMKKFSEEIRQQLMNRRVCLCGAQERTGTLLKTELEDMNSQNQLNLTIVEHPEQLKKDDLILVLGEINRTGRECFEVLDLLMHEMEKIRQSGAEAVLYLSDNRVYGKNFGPLVSRSEDELGYVCHTRPDEMDRQCMRMAEHMVVRMAEEQKLPVKIVRIEKKPDTEELVKILPWLFVLMLRGENGEIYNVESRSLEAEAAVGESAKESGREKQSLSWTEERSPLTAMEIRMNTEKVRRYVASGFFE